ncbi:acyl-CoA dehydrogenase family protein [Corynebacterium sp. AOP12-C2-36]|uniref:acyl-CoA dehydrogenase family protein n=1 Tax=Corynebacterium sp. AOP12-C2-36 TaxID=3457723 RepID=UPI0040343599
MTISVLPTNNDLTDITGHADLTDLAGLSPSHRKAVSELRAFARDVVAPTAARRDRAPLGTVEWDLMKQDHDLGGFRMGLPEAIGGLGLTTEALGYVLEAFAAADPGFALNLGATDLFQAPLMLAGNEQLNAEFLTPFLDDTLLPACNAVAEELNGTDLVLAKDAEHAQDMTTAVRSRDVYRLTDKKKYITNAPVARYATVMANLDGAPGSTGLTCFVVDLE